MSSTGSAGDADVRYEIDAQDRISFVDDRWGSFAEANDGPELTRNNIIGHVLWSQITDATTLALYQKIVAAARFSLVALCAAFHKCAAHVRMVQQGRRESGLRRVGRD